MNRDRSLRRFMRYVQCDSESGHEQAFCRLLEEEGAKLGIQFWRDPVGSRPVPMAGTWGPAFRAQGRRCFSAATWIPWPQAVGSSLWWKGGLSAPAATRCCGADDKSGIAAVMEALESLLESGKPHRPVEAPVFRMRGVGPQGGQIRRLQPVCQQGGPGAG